ncbi:MAG TPA: 4-hydroxythreonine-4-phosphate dehydrogenase PdxA, partial [bacterium]|nr:4-hydroxythreonine-4-phosphate dehydrogenase PdxA [bacterium]
MKKKYKCVITMGCPAGIGPEIILKAAAAAKIIFNETIIFGDTTVLEFYNKKYKLNLAFNLLDTPTSNNLAADKLNIFDFQNCPIDKLQIAKVSKLAGKAAIDYIAAAVDYALNKKFNAIVTAPINKDSINQAGCNFPGHTELLAYLTNTKNIGMMLVGDYLRVLLVTTHTAISNVPKLINTAKILEIIKLADNSLKNDFAIKSPKIAVLSLNPHNGENGLFGDEEIKIIAPAIAQAQKLKINVNGPFAPDTLFPKVKNNFDCVICMYHDQGLIPLKLIS